MPSFWAVVAQSTTTFVMQGCVEIVYVTLQTVLFVVIVYWMCWFQVDAGKLFSLCPTQTVLAVMLT